MSITSWIALLSIALVLGVVWPLRRYVIRLIATTRRIDAMRRELQRYDQALRASEERYRVEAQLRQAQKLEAIGQLAGGVAHDFNNILAVIQINADFLATDLGPDHPSASDVNDIKVAAEAGARLTRQLLAFSRRQQATPKPLALNAAVGELQRILTRIIGEDVAVSTVLSSKSGVIRADPGQLEQVLMNLVVNARDAMPGGGWLTIETDSEQLDALQAARLALPPGPYAVLSVTDTGCGMDAATKSRIFEPFFTTKAVGKGTGLGLANVFGIVAQSDGAIEVDSEPGRGSTFRIYLPRIADHLAESAVDAAIRDALGDAGRPDPHAKVHSPQWTSAGSRPRSARAASAEPS